VTPITPRTTAVTPRTTPPILVSVEGMEQEGSRPSNNPIVAVRRTSWIWNGIRVGTPSVKASRGVGSKPGLEMLAEPLSSTASVVIAIGADIPGDRPRQTGACGRLPAEPASTAEGAVPRSTRPGAAVLAAIPLVLQANEHLRDDSLPVGAPTSSVDGQDIVLFASLNMVGGP
jgi:hypothetical protein